jgi:Protein of unknown function (DUF1638)
MQEIDLSPSDIYEKKAPLSTVLLIACGALAREIVDLVERNAWIGFDIQCLPAKWHNTPQFIVPAIREKIQTQRKNYKSIFVLYGDCGTGGLLDAMLAEEKVERIAGPHCYAFFSGNSAFEKTAENEITAFYLTDYLARHFDKLIWEGLGLAKHPELLPMYFGNYTKIVYLAQTQDDSLQASARAAAQKLGLDYEFRFTGYGELATDLAAKAALPLA